MKISLFSRNRGSEVSFEELLAPHVDPLYRLAYRFTGKQHDAEDLVQELLIKLYPRHKELLKVESLRPWLTRALYNLFVDGVRSRNRSPIEHGYDEFMDQQSSSDLGPLQSLSRESLQQQISDALDMLPEEQRNVLILHDIEAYTLSELAEIFETPIGTLKSRLHRSREKLKKLLLAGTFERSEAC